MTKVDVFEPKEDNIQEKEEHLSSSDPIKNLLNDLEINPDQFEEIKSYVKHVENLPFIQNYINNTIGPTHDFIEAEVIDVFEINRPDDLTNFRKNLHNRRFLWHGTPKRNIGAIIQDGFKLDFVNEKAMFGSGVYFSDCCTKSLNYCRYSGDFSPISYSYLFLCEVALGKMKECKEVCFDAKKSLGDGNYGSVFGEGQWSTGDWVYDKNDVMICPGKLEHTKKSSKLMYNEFVVYDTNQIRLRYLVKVLRVRSTFMVCAMLLTFLSGLASLCYFFFWVCVYVSDILFDCFDMPFPDSLFYVFIVLFGFLFVCCLIGPIKEVTTGFKVKKAKQAKSKEKWVNNNILKL